MSWVGEHALRVFFAALFLSFHCFTLCLCLFSNLHHCICRTQFLAFSFCPEKIKQAKGNECSQYKSTAAIFSSSLPMCPIYFYLVMPRHVLSPCYAQYVHTRGIKGYVTYYLACHVRLQVQNMRYYMRLRVQNIPGCHLRKCGWGQMGRLEETNRGSTFVLTAFIFLPALLPTSPTYRMAALRVHSLARVEPTATSSPCRRNGVWTGKDILNCILVV